MKLDKMLLMLLVFGIVFVALPAAVFADDENETENVTANITVNVTENVTANVTANVTENVTANITENVTANVTTNTTTNTTIETNETDDDDNVSDEVDLEDVILGNTNYGMEVRLLQLYKSLTRNVEHGQLIIDEIENQNFSVDTDNLQDILDEAKDLNEEIKDLLDEDPVNVSTEEFVALKSESINLTFQFRKELYNLLTPEQLYAVKVALRDDFVKNSRRMNEIENRIRTKAMEHNREQALKMYQNFGLNNSELRERIESGNFTSKTLREELKYAFKEMKQTQKQNMEMKIKEERERYKEMKLSISGKKSGLNRTEMENIINDSSLNWNEKEAKIRILAQEKKQDSHLYRNDQEQNKQKRDSGNSDAGNRMR